MSERSNKCICPMKLDIKNHPELLAELAKQAHSMSELVNMTGRYTGGGSHQFVKDQVIINNIDTSHFTGQRWNKGKTKDTDPRIAAASKYESDDQILGYHPEISGCVVKRYILRHNKIPYVCALCGNTGEWNGKPLVLVLDHINGDRYDHSLENLRFVCPNCDAIGETYKNRNPHRYRE